MSYEKERQVAIAAAIDAARLCENVRQLIPAAIEKSDKSPVTVADFGAQALICRSLKAHFPEDSIVAEEDAALLRSDEGDGHLTKVTEAVQRIEPTAMPNELLNWIDSGNGQVGDRFWTLDPIDGTKGFLRQDQYAIALALVEEGQVRLGVLACPALPYKAQANELGGQVRAVCADTGDCDKHGVLFVAVRDMGTTVMPISGGEQTATRVIENADDATWRLVESVETAHGDRDRQEAIAKAAGLREPSLRMDSQAKYGALAWGQAALYLRLPSPQTPDYRENIWDHAAGSIVVEEAGGRVTDMHGKPLDFSRDPKLLDNRGIVASNGTIHDAVLEALK